VSTSLDDLVPKFRAIVEPALAELRERGIPHIVTCTGRTTAEQLDAYNRGASKCDGVRIKSKHQLGLAIDIVPPDERGTATWNYRRYRTAYKRIAAVMRAHGCICGQDWPPIDPVAGMGWDPPHYEYKGA